VNRLNTSLFHKCLLAFYDGAYDVIYDDRRYLFRKETHLKNKLIKIYAEELGAVLTSPISFLMYGVSY
jgi:hypothetical protein